MNFELLFNLVTAMLAILFAWLVMRDDQVLGKVLSQLQVESYRRDGILVIKTQIFTPEKLEEITNTLLAEADSLPQGSKTDFSSELNSAHLRNSEVLKIAREKIVVDMASQLLDSKDISIFTTRILCKMPQVGAAIPWHQDSHYWPLEPLKVASFWLALDNVTLENGGMKMVNFSGLSNIRGQNLPVVQDEEDTGPNFFQHIPAEHIPDSSVVHHSLERGQASFHDAFIPHSSPPNHSISRRCAWIVRYIPRTTRLVQSKRNDFHNHQLLPAN